MPRIAFILVFNYLLSACSTAPRTSNNHYASSSRGNIVYETAYDSYSHRYLPNYYSYDPHIHRYRPTKNYTTRYHSKKKFNHKDRHNKHQNYKYKNRNKNNYRNRSGNKLRHHNRVVRDASKRIKHNRIWHNRSAPKDIKSSHRIGIYKRSPSVKGYKNKSLRDKLKPRYRKSNRNHSVRFKKRFRRSFK